MVDLDLGKAIQWIVQQKLAWERNAEVVKKHLDREIDQQILNAKDVMRATVNKIIREEKDSPLHEAYRGTDRDRAVFLFNLKQAVSRALGEKPKPPEEPVSRVPTAQKIWEDIEKRWPGSWYSSEKTVAVKDKYAGLSVPERREAEKRDRADELRKHRDKLLVEVATAKEVKAPPIVYANIYLDSVKLLVSKGVPREKAEATAKEMVEAWRRGATMAEVTKIGEKVVPKDTDITRLFERMLAKKKRHWLDESK